MSSLPPMRASTTSRAGRARRQTISAARRVGARENGRRPLERRNNAGARTAKSKASHQREDAMDWLRGYEAGFDRRGRGARDRASRCRRRSGLTDKEIVIGLFGPLSGPLVGFGLDPVNAAKMWYDDINKKGGIHGRKIRLVIEDDKCTANDLVAVGQEAGHRRQRVHAARRLMHRGAHGGAGIHQPREGALRNAECGGRQRRDPAAALHVRRFSRHAASLRRGARRVTRSRS